MKLLWLMVMGILGLLVPGVAHAQFDYSINDGSVTITGYTGLGGAVVLPGATNGLPVTSIGDFAFDGCSNLTSIAIPGSVTNIGNLAFFNCIALTNVAMSGGLVVIGDSAFDGCTSLPGLSIPGTVTSIGYTAFASCESITNILIPASVTNLSPSVFSGCSQLAGIAVDALNPDYASAAGVLFNKNKTTLLECPSGLSGSYIMPSNVIVVADNAFGGCSNLTSVTISDNATNIAAMAFDDCAQLQSISIPNKVSFIGPFAFQGCSSLASVVIGNGLATLGEGAFSACPSLASITVNFLNPHYSSLSGILFNKNSSTIEVYPPAKSGTSYTIPGTVSVVAPYAFASCAKLSGITVPTGVVSIQEGTFNNCTNLASFTVPSTVTSIASSAFDGCSGLTNVTIGSGVTNFPSEGIVEPVQFGAGGAPFPIFTGCLRLLNINVNAQNRDYSSTNGILFNNAKNIMVRFPGGLGGSYTIPNGVTNVANAAFMDCVNLTSVTVPDNVVSLGYSAFNGCTGLTNVSFGAGVQSLGADLFENCSSLTGIYFSGNAPIENNFITLAAPPATVYYQAGTCNWNNFFSGVPQVMLNAPNPSGSLRAVIAPVEAINAGAQWQLDGGPPLPATVTLAVSGLVPPLGIGIGPTPTEVVGLAVGPHTVTFTGVSGWTNPVSQVVYVTSNSTTATVGFYSDGTSLAAIYSTNANGSLTPVAYAGSGGVLSIPGTVGGRTVTAIGPAAFEFCTNLTSVTIPTNVTSIGSSAFAYCTALTNVVIPGSVAVIGADAFEACVDLATVTMGNGVASIGLAAFNACHRLATVTIPGSITNLGSYAFSSCEILETVYFNGNAPQSDGTEFLSDPGTVYYLPGTVGWTNNYGSLAAMPWLPTLMNSTGEMGAQKKPFGFTISWATNVSVVVEACTNLLNPVWLPVKTNTLINGTNYFSDVHWTNYPGRFYRVHVE